MSSYDTISNNLPSQLCVRANPQRFVSSVSQPHEQAIFTTVSLAEMHPVLLSTNILTLGPLTALTRGIPLRVYTIGPGTRIAQNTSPADRNLPQFDATTFFAHFGGDDLSAEQFEVLWYFQEYARNGKVPGMDEETKEEVRSLGFQRIEYPGYGYNKSRHEHVYKGWKAEHLEYFWRKYCEIKIAGDEAMGTSRERSTWSYVNPPRILTAKELQRLDKAMDKKVSEHDKAEKLAITLEQRIAASRNASGEKDPKDLGSKATGLQPSGGENKTTSNKHRQTSRAKEGSYKVVKVCFSVLAVSPYIFNSMLTRISPKPNNHTAPKTSTVERAPSSHPTPTPTSPQKTKQAHLIEGAVAAPVYLQQEIWVKVVQDWKRVAAVSNHRSRTPRSQLL